MPVTSAVHMTSATLCAITRYTESPTPMHALLVARHLDCIAEEPDIESSLRELCSLLAMRWRGWIIAQTTRSFVAHHRSPQ